MCGQVEAVENPYELCSGDDKSGAYWLLRRMILLVNSHTSLRLANSW